MAHFADDADLLNINNCESSTKNHVSYGLKNLANWLKAKKLSLNIGKIVFVLFASPKKTTRYWFKNQVKWKKAYSVKYLEIQIGKNWKN